MLTHRFDDALRLASEWHRTQTRKGTSIPYLSHLMAVSALVLENGGTEDHAIAGLLHDAIEDAGQTEASLAALFGPDIARTVAECSDHSGPGRKPDWRTRKTRYLAAIATKSEAAILVTSCDKLHNAMAILTDYRTQGADVFARFTAGRDGTLWYYRQLADSLAQRRPGLLTDRLAETVARLEAASRQP